MSTHHDIPGVSFFPSEGNPAPVLTIRDFPSPAGADAAAIDARWTRLRMDNPNLFDGAILLVEPADPCLGRQAAWRSTYKVHAAGGAPALWSLGVQGLVIGRDASGVEHVLLARRSSGVRMYPGLWENAPSGVLPPPRDGTRQIGPGHFLRSLEDEGVEELGLSLRDAPHAFLGCLHDAQARSVDVVLRVNLPGVIDPRALPCPVHEGRWEYVDAAWMPTRDVHAWVGANAPAASPPTRMVVRLLA